MSMPETTAAQAAPAKNIQPRDYKMDGRGYDDRFSTLTRVLYGQTYGVSDLLEKAAHQKDKPFSYLDIGMGDGAFLTEAAGLYPSIRCHGIDTHLYNPQLLSKGIKVKIGDAQVLSRYYQPQQFDLATASNVASFLDDPVHLLLEGYKVLKSGGVLLINNFPLNDVLPDEEGIALFIKTMEETHGWKFVQKGGHPSTFDIAVVRRSKRDLALPLKPQGQKSVMLQVGNEPPFQHEYQTYALARIGTA